MRSLRPVIATLCAAFFACSAAYAQVVPSLYTPLGICELFNAPIPGSTTAYVLSRGKCNIPPTANALALVAAVSESKKRGELRVFESSLPLPSTSSMLYQGGDSSTLLLVRLCYPLDECAGEDLAIHTTQPIRLQLSVVGYFTPLWTR